MTIQETSKLLKRIKQHYQDFVVDEYKTEEWFGELKKYDVEDVNKKLEEHLKNEQFGRTIPKVYFLIKNLKTIEEKQKLENQIEFVYCPLCRTKIQTLDFELHFERCSSVNYVMKQYEKYFEKKLNWQNLMNMSEEEFSKKYYKLLKYVQKSTENDLEMKAIERVFNTTGINVNEIATKMIEEIE